MPGVQLNPEHPIDLHAATVAEAAAEEPANALREALLSHTLVFIHDCLLSGYVLHVNVMHISSSRMEEFADTLLYPPALLQAGPCQ